MGRERRQDIGGDICRGSGTLWAGVGVLAGERCAAGCTNGAKPKTTVTKYVTYVILKPKYVIDVILQARRSTSTNSGSAVSGAVTDPVSLL